MPRLTVTNTNVSPARIFDAASALQGTPAGTVINLGGQTVLSVQLDASKVSLLRNENTAEITGLIIDEDIPGVYRHPTTGTVPAFLLVNSSTVVTGAVVTYEDENTGAVATFT